MFESIQQPKPRRPINKRKATGVAVLVLVVLAVAVFLGLRAWRQRNQVDARETLQTIQAALEAFHQRYGGYPDKLERLRGGEDGQPETAPPERARLLATELAQNRLEHNGYRFRYRPDNSLQQFASRVPLFDTYQLTAEPLGSFSGRLSYATDQTGEIREKPVEEPEEEEEAQSPDEASSSSRGQ